MLLNILLLVVCGMAGLIYTFLHKFLRQPLGIHSLPLELLSEIASHLDFVDVISLRQSTRKLREATESRVVWHSLAKRYAARHFNIPRPENGTIDTLKTGDLREWIWPRLAIDQIWRKKTVTPTSRIFDLHKDAMHQCLVPGGRWLLAARQTGHVDFYDLNSTEPVLCTLLEPSAGEEEAGPTRLVVDVNHEEPVLDFTFAFNSTGSVWHRSPRLGWLHIRRARLVGTGSSATLVAHKLVSIPHIRRDSPTCAIGLHGDRVARAVVTGRYRWIEVFKWKECTGTEFLMTNICVKDTLPFGKIFFIGEDRVLCVASNIFIYKLPPLSRLVMDWDPEVGYRGDQDVTRPMWTYSKHSLDSNSAPSFSFDGTDTYRLVVQDGNDVVGFDVPLSPDQQPHARFRIQYRSLPRLGLGLYKACTGSKVAPIVRFMYKWDGDVGANFLESQGTEYSRSSEVFFDEETGRCLFRKGLEMIKIVDFV